MSHKGFSLHVAVLGAVLVAVPSCRQADQARPATSVQVVGCGVNRQISLAPGESIYLSELLKKVQPLPERAEGVVVKHPGSPPSLSQYTLQQATNASSNLGAMRPVFAGDVVCFVFGLSSQ